MASYERTLRVVLLIDGLLGLLLLLWPNLLVPNLTMHAAGASTWARPAGLLLMLLSVALLPAAILALANQFLAVFAAAAQLLLGLMFAWSGARLSSVLAIYCFLSAYLLLAAFWRGLRQYLLSKP